MFGSHRRSRRQHQEPELELTAFINPMVVLVTFLLMNVVFSHTAVMDLKLPGPVSSGSPAQSDKLLLEVTVRQDAIELGDRNRGRLFDVPNTASGPDYEQLTAQLLKIKDQYPTERGASLLVEPDISYDRMVQVMDAVRGAVRQVDGHRFVTELFPEISIGDAPVASPAGS
jgi:biopolymer transport protein ExbD